MSYESEGREFYTHHVGMVLNNDHGVECEVREWIAENLSDHEKDVAIELLSDWMEEVYEEAVYSALEMLPIGIGGSLICELLDMNLVDWREIAEGYLEDYEPETDEEESEEDEIENDHTENCTVFRGESVGPMRSDY